MLRPVPPAQIVDEQRHPRGVSVGRVRDVSDRAGLPDEERDGGIDRARVEEQLRGLVALAAGARRVDAEVGEQARLGRDSGQHARVEPLLARAADRVVRRLDEDAGMTVEGGANGVFPRRTGARIVVDDRRVGLRRSRPGSYSAWSDRAFALTLSIHCAATGSATRYSTSSARFERCEHLQRDVARDLDPEPDDRQRAARRRHRCYFDFGGFTSTNMKHGTTMTSADRYSSRIASRIFRDCRSSGSSAAPR